MNAPRRKGWCPSLMRPMASGDGLLVRVKPPASRLTGAQAKIVADAARRHGNGTIDLTNRGNLQIRGLTDEGVASFAEAIVACGLAVPDPDAEGARTVLVDPLGPDDPAVDADSHALGRAIEARLAASRDLHRLPGKFGFLVDAGISLPARAPETDIELRACDTGWCIRLAGCAEGALVTGDEDAAAAAIELARGFLALAEARPGTVRRMRDATRDGGGRRLLTDAGLTPVETQAAAQDESGTPVGFVDLGGSEPGAFVAAAAFGSLDGDALRGLARLAERYGDGTLRMTAWKALVVPSVRPEAATELAGEAAALGLVVGADDPRRRFFACPGRPACGSASVDTRADAARLARLVDADGDRIHVSGCSKGCAHPGPCAQTLVGRDGRYDLVRDGGADGTPGSRGLTFAQVAARLQSGAAS